MQLQQLGHFDVWHTRVVSQIAAVCAARTACVSGRVNTYSGVMPHQAYDQYAQQTHCFQGLFVAVRLIVCSRESYLSKRSRKQEMSLDCSLLVCARGSLMWKKRTLRISITWSVGGRYQRKIGLGVDAIDPTICATQATLTLNDTVKMTTKRVWTETT